LATPTKLSISEIAEALATLPGWSLSEGKLFKEYHFSDFVHAFGFMTIAALRIEVLNHHPEWFNVYRTVKVYLSTHDAGGISVKDVELARILDQLAAKLQ